MCKRARVCACGVCAHASSHVCTHCVPACTCLLSPGRKLRDVTAPLDPEQGWWVPCDPCTCSSPCGFSLVESHAGPGCSLWWRSPCRAGLSAGNSALQSPRTQACFRKARGGAGRSWDTNHGTPGKQPDVLSDGTGEQKSGARCQLWGSSPASSGSAAL